MWRRGPGRCRAPSDLDAETGIRTYRVTGQIFFATGGLPLGLRFREEGLKGVVIDLHASHFWDISSISALDRVVLKFRHHDIPVEIVGMNEATATMVERLATYTDDSVRLMPLGH